MRKWFNELYAEFENMPRKEVLLFGFCMFLLGVAAGVTLIYITHYPNVH